VGEDRRLAYLMTISRFCCTGGIAVLVTFGVRLASAPLFAAEVPPPSATDNATALAASGVVLHSLDEPDPARDTRVAWHKEARFGCFVHWGVYSALANEWHGKKGGGYAEHIMRVMKIPRATYLEEVAKPFNPEKFDADAWVKLMHDAGMRYLVITAKHHDGFAMYPSKVSDFNITVTQFKRDPMVELATACKKYGLRFGFYYSHAFDWEHPDAPGNDWDYANPGGDKLIGGRDWWGADSAGASKADTTEDADANNYVANRKNAAKTNRADFLPRAQHYVTVKSIPQIQELIRTYRPDIMWFDTPHKLPPEENRRILAALRATDSHVVVNGRLLRGYGDYQSTADRPAYVADTPGHWEGIPTTNESYGYSKFDHSQKPPEHFVRLLVQSVSKGGNMLMNIGPKGDGTIDEADQKILRGIGAWMAKNSGSIYGCDRTPLAVQNWGTSTWNPQTHTLYLHVFSWPKDGKLVVGGLKTDPQSIAVLGAAATAGKPAFKRVNPDDLEVTVSNVSADPIDTVLKLNFAGDIATSSARLISVTDMNVLHVMDGHLSGKGVGYGDGKRNRDTTVGWRDLRAGVDWPVRLTAGGRFIVKANYATAKSGGGTFRVALGDQAVEAEVQPTSNDATFTTAEVGTLTLPAGENTLTVRPVKISGGDLMRLRTIELTPAP
jgi:alpha-L-fucosidase